jgi:energy-coupling factor transporter transmembrane protein EcfT
MRARVRQIIDAQQCRGLRIGGSPLARVRALGPLVVPLVLSALAEVDEQALALDVRGGTAAGRRTALEPPADRGADRLVRWMVLVGVVAAYAWKFAGAGR